MAIIDPENPPWTDEMLGKDVTLRPGRPQAKAADKATRKVAKGTARRR